MLADLAFGALRLAVPQVPAAPLVFETPFGQTRVRLTNDATSKQRCQQLARCPSQPESGLHGYCTMRA